MSATAPLRRPAALRLPAPAQAKPAQPRPRLVLISGRRPTAGRLPFLIVIGAVLAIGLVAVLMLHMVAAQDAYRANALQQKLATLHNQEQELASQVEADSAPSVLRHRAAALGMRPGVVAKFHLLKDGRAVGLQTPLAYTQPAPAVTATKAKASNSAKSTKAAGTKASTTKPAKHTATTSTTKNAAGTTKTGEKKKPTKP
ncbi:MAG: hypothetical protein JO246_17025 [Frankiaceae bacterium]|nr:hypothetical protein [Frankiaceae bacterium]MBV9870398.1 hypothetical protein [Frankiaceae bacterium]